MLPASPGLHFCPLPSPPLLLPSQAASAVRGSGGGGGRADGGGAARGGHGPCGGQYVQGQAALCGGWGEERQRRSKGFASPRVVPLTLASSLLHQPALMSASLPSLPSHCDGAPPCNFPPPYTSNEDAQVFKTRIAAFPHSPLSPLSPLRPMGTRRCSRPGWLRLRSSACGTASSRASYRCAPALKGSRSRRVYRLVPAAEARASLSSRWDPAGWCTCGYFLGSVLARL